jgi:VWFA-related protein
MTGTLIPQGRRWAIVTVAAIAGASLSAQVPQFRSTTEAVTVDVSVRDRTRVVPNLAAEDFEVLDNGVAQKVLDVSFGKLPIDVTVALDVSLSVDGQRLNQMRTGIRQLMVDLGPEDRLRLVAFNMRVSRVLDFTNDVAAADRALQDFSAGGGTAIWDTAATLIAAAHPEDRRHLLVLFTDGTDSVSFTATDSLVALAQRMTTTISSVVPTTIQLTVRTPLPAGGRLLETLATETGGSFVRMTSPRQDLGETFRRALDQFRSTYVLHFRPEKAGPGFHTLQVSVRGKSKYTVTARRGYFR